MKPNNPHIPCFTGDEKTGFHAIDGIVEIKKTNNKEYVISTQRGTFTNKGKIVPSYVNPALFNSFKQFQDYWNYEMKAPEYVLAKDYRCFHMGDSVKYAVSLGIWHVSNPAVDFNAELSTGTETKDSARDRLIRDGWVKEVE